MTNTTSAMARQLAMAPEAMPGWLRGVVIVGVMTLLALGMTPDGGRHIRATTLENNAKLILSAGIGMVTAGRFMARRSPVAD